MGYKMDINKALVFLQDCIDSVENSYELKEFYIFKDDILHFQAFDMICKYVAIFLEKKVQDN